MVAVDSTFTSPQTTGWMVQHPSSSGSSSQEAKQKLVSLFSTYKTHRFSEERLSWLIMWTGADSYDSLDKLSVETFAIRYGFLEASWNNVALFRPFDTITSSVSHLQENPEHHYLARLSTSVPGSITFTFRMNNNTIKHTRFTLNLQGSLVDSQGNSHSSLNSLSTWFSSTQLKAFYQALPAGYVQINM